MNWYPSVQYFSLVVLWANVSAVKLGYIACVVYIAANWTTPFRCRDLNMTGSSSYVIMEMRWREKTYIHWCDSRRCPAKLTKMCWLQIFLIVGLVDWVKCQEIQHMTTEEKNTIRSETAVTAWSYCQKSSFIDLSSLRRDRIVEMFDHAYGSYMVSRSFKYVLFL